MADWREDFRFLMASPHHAQAAPTRQQRRNMARLAARSTAADQREAERTRAKMEKYARGRRKENNAAFAKMGLTTEA